MANAKKAPRSQKFVEYLKETAWGRFAEGVHERTLSKWPYAVRMAIAVFWDFVVDTPLRIVSWFIPIPFAVEVIRIPLDIVLAFGALMLWGTPGLLQSGEFALGFIPVIGRVLDVLPMLTIAGIVAKQQEQETKSAMMPAMEVPSMEILVGLVALIVGALLWWNSVIGFWSIFWLAGGAVGTTFALRVARRGAIPDSAVRLVRIVFGIALAIDLAGLATFAFILTPEFYRIRAWEELQKNTFFSLQVKAAKAADDAGKRIDLQLHNLGQGSSLTGYARNKLADVLVGKRAKSENKPPRIVSGVDDKKPSAVKKFFSWVGEDIIRPGEEKEDAKKSEAAKKDFTVIETKAAGLGLGPMRSKLFASDAVLGKAGEMRDEDSVWLWTLLPWFSGLFGFAIVFGCIQTRERNYVRPEPQAPLDRFV